MEFEVTVSFKFKPKPENYGGLTDPVAMAEVDEDSFKDDPELLLQALDEHPYTVTVKPSTESNT